MGRCRNTARTKDARRWCSRPLNRSLHLGQYFSKVIETPSPRWTNAPDRHTQLLGDLLVRQIVIAHQQTEQTLAAWREPLCRRSYCSLLFLSKEGSVERICLVISHEVQRVRRRNHDLPGSDPQAFAPRGRCQPRTETLWLLDSVQILHEPQPGCLTDFCDVSVTQTAPSGNSRHQAPKSADEVLPSSAYPVVGLCDNQNKLGVIGRCIYRCVLTADRSLRTLIDRHQNSFSISYWVGRPPASGDQMDSCVPDRVVCHTNSPEQFGDSSSPLLGIDDPKNLGEHDVSTGDRATSHRYKWTLWEDEQTAILRRAIVLSLRADRPWRSVPYSGPRDFVAHASSDLGA